MSISNKWNEKREWYYPNSRICHCQSLLFNRYAWNYYYWRQHLSFCKWKWIKTNNHLSQFIKIIWISIVSRTLHTKLIYSLLNSTFLNRFLFFLFFSSTTFISFHFYLFVKLSFEMELCCALLTLGLEFGKKPFIQRFTDLYLKKVKTYFLEFTATNIFFGLNSIGESNNKNWSLKSKENQNV